VIFNHFSLKNKEDSMKVTADYRERNSELISLLNRESTQLIFRKIPYGDYLINEAVTVERKSDRDFLMSIIDGRLFRQVACLKKYSVRPLVLIEGNPYKTDVDVDPMAIKGAIVSVQAIWYIPVLFSCSAEDSVSVFKLVANQYEKYSETIPLRTGYRPKRLITQQLYALQGLPEIGPALSLRLLRHFKSVMHVVKASTDELSGVAGIGPVRAQKIREVLDTEGLLKAR
jgi:Fanconi anemia group M protein